ncbi:response regulator transcription factor [Tumebacillus sp. ITR2]|uniref:Response regulator transcription factor n=1 Tax=Tumebacillus amylolyticus TaxID=2801339 RepID=A0ABS1J5N0_9BACL|nr:response regulator transcription factor [Tumebacillus amylolyticus]MBL0385584.1 response regulator transcription factor [Tumebacillus amylolyticus]
MFQRNATILVVDDERQMRALIRSALETEGREIIEAASGEEALSLVHRTHFDLIILDIMMPGSDGWEVCSRVREHCNVPILFLSARNETRDKVRGLRIGADDYLTKPFDLEELAARVHALLRRSVAESIDSADNEEIHLHELTILQESREVKVDGRQVAFTPKEFDLLMLLSRNPKKAFTRDNLLQQVWGLDFHGDIRTVDQHVKNIREKLKRGGCTFNPIKTVWGIGYQMQGKDGLS